MKILSIVHRYHPAVGGAEIHMQMVNRMLAERGHSVTVATTDAADFALFWDPRARRFDEPQSADHGVKILRFPVQHLPLAKIAFPAMRLLTAGAARLVGDGRLVDKLTTLTPHVPALARWLDQCKDEFDVVLAMPITLEGLQKLGQTFARQRGIPFVTFPLTHLGGGPAPGTDGVSRFYTLPQQRAIVLAADGVVANNPAEKEFYMARGLAEQKVIVAPPAPAVDELAGGDGQAWRTAHAIPPEVPLVCVVSALTKDKGTMQTVRAMQQLWAAGETARLVLAGSPMADFEPFWESIPAEDRAKIILLGKISNGERNDLLAAAAIFCMPSIVESFGLAFTEAWLYKKPVIGANVWGVRDHVIRPEVNGLLVEHGDVAGLAAAVRRLIDDRPLREKLGANGYDWVVNELSWEKSVDKIEALLHKLSNGQRRTDSSE